MSRLKSTDGYDESQLKKLNEFEIILADSLYLNGNTVTSMDKEGLDDIGETPPNAE